MHHYFRIDWLASAKRVLLCMFCDAFSMFRSPFAPVNFSFSSPLSPASLPHQPLRRSAFLVWILALSSMLFIMSLLF